MQDVIRNICNPESYNQGRGIQHIHKRLQTYVEGVNIF